MKIYSSYWTPYPFTALGTVEPVYNDIRLHDTSLKATDNFFLLLFIKHAPLPWVILNAVGLQLGSISGDTVASITRCRQSLYSLYNLIALVIVWIVYVYSLLQLIEIYGFCKDEERLYVFRYQFLLACWPVPGFLDVYSE